ncbi:MAG: Uma2 family endonuclease [Oscillospiraceae bacterium]|nr:Uma2 family endonuclease [Oscillospiraceae bacterium]
MAVPEERRYTAEEFYALTGEERCELIDGYIVDMSPSPNFIHQEISAQMHTDIMNFIRSQKGKCKALATFDVHLNDNTVVEPDLLVACDPDKFDSKKHLGAPDWVIEIVSPSNFSNDYYTKLQLYKEHGVREYWIVDPRNCHVTVHIHDGDFNAIDIYSFSDKIPVYIFKDKTPPLEICIADYTESLEN